MEASPLTRLSQPDVLTPKIHQLYSELFKDEEEIEKSEGFWKEFFLLNPDREVLRKTLQAIPAAEMLAFEARSRELFSSSLEALNNGTESEKLNALDTLTVFLACVLSKRYAHPSSAIISLLAGIDNIDTVFTKFIGILESIVRSGPTLEVRYKAVEVLLALMAGAYQTTLLTYMIQRDLFPSIMKLIQESDSWENVFEPLVLISLLANYNKFEFQNPYQLRLNDFVNEPTIRTVIRSIGLICQQARNEYIAVQDDLPESWTVSSTLNMIGLGAIAPGGRVDKKAVYDAETAKQLFTKLPGTIAAILLAMYDFSHANKLFCFTLFSISPEDNVEHPVSSYLSLTSYLLQHAHLSQRSTYYAHLNLMVLRLLIEDNAICKRISSDESKMAVRLCRHRAPFLPLAKLERPTICAILDIMIDGINHNLKKKLDVSLYTLCLGILLRAISYLSRSNTRLTYHWHEFFRSLLSLVRFLTTYTADLKDLEHIDTLVDHVVNLIALSLSAGEGFLPSPAAYDDLFYKVVESGDVLSKFKENYALGKKNSSSIDTLINVSKHYEQLLAEHGSSASKKKSSLTAGQVTQVIKQGYETLSIQASEGLDSWDRYREADERMLLKRMARTVVDDVNELIVSVRK